MTPPTLATRSAFVAAEERRRAAAAGGAPPPAPAPAAGASAVQAALLHNLGDSSLLQPGLSTLDSFPNFLTQISRRLVPAPPRRRA